MEKSTRLSAQRSAGESDGMEIKSIAWSFYTTPWDAEWCDGTAHVETADGTTHEYSCDFVVIGYDNATADSIDADEKMLTFAVNRIDRLTIKNRIGEYFNVPHEIIKIGRMK